jgi:hypothetical protein
MFRVKILSLLLALGVSGVLFAGQQVDLSKAKIVVLAPKNKIMANAGDMLGDEIDKRTRIGLDVVSKLPRSTEVAVVIGTKKALRMKGYKPPAGFDVPAKADAYSVWVDTSKRSSATICAAGHDVRGTLFAVGRILRNLKMSRDTVSIDVDYKIATAPRWGLRGHQLGYRAKTNSYDAWDVPMWEQYYRDMVVFGMNAIELIPPKSDDDDDSPHLPKPQLEMMVLMSQLAADYGLDVWAWWPAIDGDYKDPKVVQGAIAEWGEVLSKLPKIDVIFVPGGDPGNTHPEILMKFMEKQKKNLNKYHPNAEMWLSPQGFDWRSRREGWMPAFIKIMQEEQPAWLDGIVFGPQIKMSLPELRSLIPAKYPIRRYPDITHCRSSQYAVPNWDKAYSRTEGREPINPRPRAYAKIFRDLQNYAMGFITYSEGCNDDVNKIIWSCLGWDPEMKVEDILREYSRYFISGRYEEKFAEGLLGLEKNWEGKTLENENSYATLALFQEMERNATPQEKLNWRFQQGLYRAYYDSYIKQRLMYETELEDQAKAVLASIDQGSSEEAAIKEAQAIVDKATTEPVAQELRARVFELAEALYQSIRMQLSVDRYQAIRIGRGANLDEIDKPLTGLRDIRRYLERRRKSSSLKSDGGLVGQYYNSSGFASPEEGMVDLLSTINHKWDKDRGNDWSARWFGFIEGPVTGEVTFTAEARDKIRLTVGRTVVIDSFGKNGARVGKVGMVKGKRVPVKLEFSSDNGKALLRLYWQWSGQGKQLVPDSALSHTPDMVPDDAVLFDYENKLSEG